MILIWGQVIMMLIGSRVIMILIGNSSGWTWLLRAVMLIVCLVIGEDMGQLVQAPLWLSPITWGPHVILV